MMRYIKQTDIWRKYNNNIEGGKRGKKRMNILDYGAGGGVLAEALAKEGKDTVSVVALDMCDYATRAARRRLQPYPNAKAMKARNFGPSLSTSKISGSLIGFRKNQFDLIVSYRGALSSGTSKSNNRLHPFWALHSATRVCKDGGSVIIGKFSRNEILRVDSQAYLINIKSLMELVGLTDVKHCRQIVFRSTQPMLKIFPFERWIIAPKILHIYQGTVNKTTEEYRKRHAELEQSFKKHSNQESQMKYGCI